MGSNAFLRRDGGRGMWISPSRTRCFVLFTRHAMCSSHAAWIAHLAWLTRPAFGGGLWLMCLFPLAASLANLYTSNQLQARVDCDDEASPCLGGYRRGWIFEQGERVDFTGIYTDSKGHACCVLAFCGGERPQPPDRHDESTYDGHGAAIGTQL